MDNFVSLPALFSQRLFEVPDYQRGYSWESQQVQEFLEDLELLGPRHYHYTGTVILHESRSKQPLMDQDGDIFVTVNVVDGQQRLTTIVMLLDEIQRSLAGYSDKGKMLSRGIKKNYISALAISGRPLFKLSLNKDTNNFFKNSVLTEQPSPSGSQNTSERRLAAAKKQIADYITSKINDGVGEEWLQTLYSKLATQLRFNLYEVEDSVEVGVIFEVVNDRGKPLTNLEKVKNYLLYASNHVSTSLNVPNDLAESINEAWSKVIRQLTMASLESSADEDRLLRADWLTHHNPGVRQWNGSRSVKGKFDLRKYQGKYEILLNTLHLYVGGLRNSSESFCDAYAPHRTGAFGSFEENPKTRDQVVTWSEKLRRVGVLVPFLPLLIAARERWPNDPHKYLEILKLCEAFSFRVYRLNGSRADAGQYMLFRLGHDVANNSEDFDSIISHLKYELDYRCNDKAFERLISAESQQVNRAYYWSGLRYFLYEYETDLASKKRASPKVSWEDLQRLDRRDTIEHVLPQSIDQQPYWRNRFTEQEHQRYLHDLGNLTLTRFNPSLGNKAFPMKKGALDASGHCYAKSALFVELELTLFQDWDASTIEKRRADLLKWARSRWAVDMSGLRDQEREPDDEVEEETD